MTQEMTSKDLIEYAAGIGHKVTLRQLERWRAACAIPRGRQHGQGKGPGARWLYPEEAPAALRRFLEIRVPSERLDETVVRMWLAGSNIPMPALRGHLSSAATSVHKRLRKMTTTRGGAKGLGEFIVDCAIRSPKSRKTFGATKMDPATCARIQGAGEALATVMLNPDASLPAGAAENLEAMLSLSESDKAIISGLGADAQTELTTMLPEVARMEEMLETATDDDVVHARGMLFEMGKLVVLAKALPIEDPRRSFLLRTSILKQDAYGLASMVLVIERVKTGGTVDPFAEISALMKVLQR